MPSFDVYLVMHRKRERERDWLSPMSRHENARLRDNRVWVDVKWYWWKEYSFWGWSLEKCFPSDGHLICNYFALNTIILKFL